MTATHSVVVVDDDESVREALPQLLRAMGFDAASFASAEEFLDASATLHPDCLIVDVTMPGMSGPALQQEVTRRGVAIPIIYITAHETERLRSRLLAGGAVACLFKPFSSEDLRNAVNAALRIA